MTHGAEFVGRLEINPPLNDDEIAYLTAFVGSRRCWRMGGDYAVPEDLTAERTLQHMPEMAPGVIEATTVPPGQPSLWCDWQVCSGGCCLVWSPDRESDQTIPWLRYLIKHFLKPAARARGHQGFEYFSFDHRLDGVIVGYRSETRELTQVAVSGNRVTTKLLHQPTRECSARPTRRHRPRTVVQLSERRARV